MKKIFICVILAGMIVPPVFAQEPEPVSGEIPAAKIPVKERPRYFNISYGKQTLKFGEGDAIKSDYAAAITRGRTYYLHKKPIAGLIRFGLDWTTFDLNFAGYSEKYEEYGETEKYNMYQLEAGMHVGPSVMVTPLPGLGVNAYFRYAPSFTAFYDSEEFYYNYGSFFVVGGAISYKVISLGVESRWGSSKFKLEDEDAFGDLSKEKIKVKTSGTRIYLGFRF